MSSAQQRTELGADGAGYRSFTRMRPTEAAAAGPGSTEPRRMKDRLEESAVVASGVFMLAGGIMVWYSWLA